MVAASYIIAVYSYTCAPNAGIYIRMYLTLCMLFLATLAPHWCHYVRTQRSTYVATLIHPTLVHVGITSALLGIRYIRYVTLSLRTSAELKIAMAVTLTVRMVALFFSLLFCLGLFTSAQVATGKH